MVRCRIMTSSQQIAGLLGPSLMVTIASEFPLVQPHLYDEQIPPVVYLSGLLAFVAGLAIVRAHNFWRRDWTLLVTSSGWVLLALGLVRMFTAADYRQAAAGTTPTVFMLIEAPLFLAGLVMTVKAYGRRTR